MGHETLLDVLRETRALLARSDSDFSWSSWHDQAAALAEIDGFIDQIMAGKNVDIDAVSALFLPTGDVQEVSISRGWGADFLRLARRCDRAVASLQRSRDTSAMAGQAKRRSDARLAWRYRLHVLGGLWGGIILAVVAAAFFIALYAWQTSVRTEPATPVRGTITSIALISGGDSGDDLMITARMPDGAIRQSRMAIARQALRGCRVGGPVIFLLRGGNRWTLSGTPCLIDGREIG